MFRSSIISTVCAGVLSAAQTAHVENKTVTLSHSVLDFNNQKVGQANTPGNNN